MAKKSAGNEKTKRNRTTRVVITSNSGKVFLTIERSSKRNPVTATKRIGRREVRSLVKALAAYL
jgi:hypothetical protein